MAYYKIGLSFFTLFVIVHLCWCSLAPVYDLGKGTRKFFNVSKPLKFECKVTDPGEKASDIKWGKEELENLENSKFVIKADGDKSQLEIHKTETSDDGTYYCEYKNSKFQFEAIANVEVKIKPTNDVSVVEGETLNLKCSGVGTKLRITWVFDDNITDVKYGKEGDLENASIEIRDVKKSYRGNYTCVGSHDESLDIDQVAESTAYVRVKDKYAALWPFILICIEVFILCAIILIYEKHRSHAEIEDSETEPDQKNGKN